MNVLIIHGNSNRGFVLNRDSFDRTRKALEILKTESYDSIIPTGGIFEKSQENISVAHAMKHALEDCWLEEKIQIESESLTTIDNVEELLSMIGENDSTTVITSNYHAFRTWLIWKLIGKRNVKVVGAKSKITLKKLFVEFVGIGVVIAYAIGFKWPELYFRAKARTIKTVD